MTDVAESSVPPLEWSSDTDFSVGGTTFRANPVDRFTSSADLFCVVKRPDLVEAYHRLVSELAPRRIVELGICKGGSTALLAAITHPEMLAAFELAERPVRALAEFIEARGLSDSVRPHYGVNQADPEQMKSLLREDFGDRPLDLVIDDASHDFELTAASFNVLFPMLRPGGLFVIEDWAWVHFGYGTQRPDDVPLTAFVFQVLMALPSRLGIIDDVVVDRDWAVVRRGPAPLDPDKFDIATCYSERARDLVGPLRDRAVPEPGPGA